MEVKSESEGAQRMLLWTQGSLGEVLREEATQDEMRDELMKQR